MENKIPPRSMVAPIVILRSDIDCKADGVYCGFLEGHKRILSIKQDKLEGVYSEVGTLYSENTGSKKPLDEPGLMVVFNTDVYFGSSTQLPSNTHGLYFSDRKTSDPIGTPNNGKLSLVIPESLVEKVLARDGQSLLWLRGK
jgi:hypothetical protein